MVGRDGGKAKPLKQPKKAEKVVLDEDIEFKKKMVRPCWFHNQTVLLGRGEEEDGRGSKGHGEEVDDYEAKYD